MYLNAVTPLRRSAYGLGIVHPRQELHHERAEAGCVGGAQIKGNERIFAARIRHRATFREHFYPPMPPPRELICVIPLRRLNSARLCCDVVAAFLAAFFALFFRAAIILPPFYPLRVPVVGTIFAPANIIHPYPVQVAAVVISPSLYGADLCA